VNVIEKVVFKEMETLRLHSDLELIMRLRQAREEKRTSSSSSSSSSSSPRRP